MLTLVILRKEWAAAFAALPVDFIQNYAPKAVLELDEFFKTCPIKCRM